jgi:hypothetical protein
MPSLLLLLGFSESGLGGGPYVADAPIFLYTLHVKTEHKYENIAIRCCCSFNSVRGTARRCL